MENYDYQHGSASRRALSVGQVVRMVFWAGLLALGARVTVAIPHVPITLQTFFLMLAGLLDGPRIAFYAGFIYVIAGLCGAPVFADGAGGWHMLSSAGIGFLFAFPFAGSIAAMHFDQYEDRRFGAKLLASVVAHGVILLGGFAGLVINTGVDPTSAAVSLKVYVPGALVKSAAAALVATILAPLWRRVFWR